jgi:hypothetical protein
MEQFSSQADDVSQVVTIASRSGFRLVTEPLLKAIPSIGQVAI